MAPLLILFIHLGLGGVQRKIVDIVNFLASYQPDLPIVILLRNRESFDLSSEIKNRNVTIINYQDWVVNWRKIPFFFPLFIIDQIGKLKPQAILAFLDFVSLPCIFARLLKPWRKFRLVLSEDHYASRIIPTFTFGRLRGFLVRVFYPLADAIFTCSQATRKDLVENYHLPERRVKVIRNWTTFSEKNLAIIRKKYDFLYLGRMVATKNLGFLIKMVKKLKDKGREMTLCLVGYGKEEENLKKLVSRLHLKDKVFFLAPRLGVPQLMAQSRILVYSSQVKAEGLPMVILEAMALGLPVLTKNFAGSGEFLKDGKNCAIFQHKAEFLKKATWLLDDNKYRQGIISRAKEYVKTYHSPKNILFYLRELGLEK